MVALSCSSSSPTDRHSPILRIHCSIIQVGTTICSTTPFTKFTDALKLLTMTATCYVVLAAFAIFLVWLGCEHLQPWSSERNEDTESLKSSPAYSTTFKVNKVYNMFDESSPSSKVATGPGSTEKPGLIKSSPPPSAARKGSPVRVSRPAADIHATTAKFSKFINMQTPISDYGNQLART